MPCDLSTTTDQSILRNSREMSHLVNNVILTGKRLHPNKKKYVLFIKNKINELLQLKKYIFTTFNTMAFKRPSNFQNYVLVF